MILFTKSAIYARREIKGTVLQIISRCNFVAVNTEKYVIEAFGINYDNSQFRK